jgi:hypothetical protein
MKKMSKKEGGVVMSVLTTKPRFLYPRSREYPFDKVAKKIVRALEKRNWKVPGITVKFDSYGSGEAKYQMVRQITGDNFKLYFSRNQGHLDGWSDHAAIHSICIPKQILEVYEDGSDSNLYLYVGNNWEAEKRQFMNSTKVHSKMNREPKTYLKYSYHRHQQVKDLVADNDQDREYDPEGKEPTSFELKSTFLNIAIWLVLFVLNSILIYPEAKTIEPPIPMEELIPYTGPWPTVFTLCGWEAAEKVKKGKQDPKQLPLEERYAFFGGRRLVPMDVQCNNRFPEIAYEGFTWCDVNQGITPNSKRDDISSDIRWSISSYDTNIVCIRLKYVNHVYVADQSAYDETREQLFEAIAPRERLTEAEYRNVLAARGATIVPITEYKGNYKNPILLISRELDFDEIEWIFDTKEKQ